MSSHLRPGNVSPAVAQCIHCSALTLQATPYAVTVVCYSTCCTLTKNGRFPVLGLQYGTPQQTRNQLAHVILVHNWNRSTSTCFHLYSREIHVFCLLSQVLNEFDTSRTGSELVRTVSLTHIITHDFMVIMCRHNKFVHRIR